MLLNIVAAACVLLTAGQMVLTGREIRYPREEFWQRGPASERDLVRQVRKVKPGNPVAALNKFDHFSESNRLGLNLGKPKGLIIEEAVHEAIAAQKGQDEVQPLAILEVGAHLGDGTLRIVSALKKNPPTNLKSGGSPHYIFSLESNEGWASGCKVVVAHAMEGELANSIHHESVLVSPGHVPQAAEEILKYLKTQPGAPQKFSLVLLDHEHPRYLPDLKKMEELGVLAPGCIVHADNAGRDEWILTEYLDYVKAGGSFSTSLKEVSEPYPDAVAISRYRPSKPGSEL